MSKKARFRGVYEKQHRKRAQTLLKSEWQHLYHIYRPLSRQLSSKESLWKICKNLRLFVNTLTADNKYSLINKDILKQPI